jgi:predicted ArsR family transcriptional regulator
LGELGSLVEVETVGEQVLIRGSGCPLADVVPNHPEACQLVEALVADMMGVPVRRRCEMAPPPRRRFELATGSQSRRGAR